MNNNFDMNKLMGILSKMDKKQLEDGLEKLQQMINSNDNKNINNNNQ
jgi:hypothetical protein